MKIAPKSQIIIYKTAAGDTKIDVRFENETVWLTQNALAKLFQTTKQNISQHIKNIFEEDELQQDSVVKDFLTTAADGKNYLTEQELLVLNNLVEQYLVFAEGQAMQRIPMYMQDWIDKLHAFLQINNKNILRDVGKISHELAIEIAERNFDEYQKNEVKHLDSDFDEVALRALKTIKKNKFAKNHL